MVNNYNFKGTIWKEKIDVRDFVFNNITKYDGDDSFLFGISKRTELIWNECKDLLKKEFNSENGVLDIDTDTVSEIDSHKAGYVDKENELIVGFQTDAPLKRAMKPFGGYRVVKKAVEENNRVVNPVLDTIFKYRKTHNDGVFDVYTPRIRQLRSIGMITGLPDNYARGRIIGDYRRIALYGIDRLIEEKKKDQLRLDGDMTNELIQLREEVSEQIKALNEMKTMGLAYGLDLSRPAESAQEAVQWTYMGYLAAVKEQDGAAMSLGNVSSFFDVFIESDLKSGNITEEFAQELIDQFVIKLRLVRQLRMSAYNDIFAGDPTWVTEALAGTWHNGEHKVTKTTFRFLQTLYNLGPSPEPNLTVLWSKALPENFKKFAAKVSVETSSIQYENDDLMREQTACDDYGIACCVSLMKIGKHIQFFGARCNLAKTLLLALNKGHDENKNELLVEGIDELKSKEGSLNYEEVMENFKKCMKSVAKDYVNTMNIIHYMHDKYYYEKAQLALLDSEIERSMAFGIAGFSIVADSLSAIKYAKVTPVRCENGLTVDFKIEGDFPKYGNDDNRADEIANEVLELFNNELKSHHIYRNATPTLSILTITSNVVYGKKTGATPDGRKSGVAFAPGANPMHGRDSSGAIASLNSVAKVPYANALDGVSNTFSILPQTLGDDTESRVENLVDLMNGYFSKGAHHLNVNVLNRETLIHAMEHPEEHPQLTIRVSGYAVNFVKLTREQQEEVLSRTFFNKISN